MKQAYIEAGRITNTHGVRGEVKIEVWLDSPESLKKYPRLFADGAEYRILSARPQGRFVIAELEGITDVNSAVKLKGKTVFIARVDARLPDGGYFLQDLIGAEVFDEDGNRVGVLTEILEKPASDVYVVRDDSGTEHMIPAVPAFLRRVDADAGIITVHMIEGL